MKNLRKRQANRSKDVSLIKNETLARIEQNFKKYEEMINTLSEELKSKEKESATADKKEWEEALLALSERVGDLEKSVIKLIKHAHHHGES